MANNLSPEAQLFLDKVSGNIREHFDEFKALSFPLQKEIVLHRYQLQRESISQFFVPENAQAESRQEHLSPSGRYKLVITPFSTTPKGWNYSQGLVYEVGKDEPIFEVQRNYCAFPFCWIENHLNGHHYLVCGEDYQGQTILELDTGERVDHCALSRIAGSGFCWATMTPSPNGSLLAVEGCYWAAPYELVIYDFSEPLSPLIEIYRDQHNDVFDGWLDDNSCKVGIMQEFYQTLDGEERLYTGFETHEEFEAIWEMGAALGIDEDDVLQERVKSIVWTRPSNLDIAKTFIKQSLGAYQKYGYKTYHPEEDANLTSLLNRLTPEDLEALRSDSEIKGLLDYREGLEVKL